MILPFFLRIKTLTQLGKDNKSGSKTKNMIHDSIKIARLGSALKAVKDRLDNENNSCRRLFRHQIPGFDDCFRRTFSKIENHFDQFKSVAARVKNSKGIILNSKPDTLLTNRQENV